MDDRAETPAGEEVAIAVLRNDVNAVGLAPRILDRPDDGTVRVVGDEVEYTPRAGFEGEDTFRYTLAGGGRTFGAATVTVTVADAGTGTTGGSPDPTTSPEPAREPSEPTPGPGPTPGPTPEPTPEPSPPTPPRLTVDVRSASPGAPVTVRGTACPPRAAVEIAVDGDVVTSVEASGSGTFRAQLAAPERIGRHAVSVTCGRATQETELDVVVTTLQSATQAPAAAAAVAAGLLLFFLLSGLGLNPTGRRGYATRRRGEAP